jgi:hypothetical protein
VATTPIEAVSADDRDLGFGNKVSQTVHSRSSYLADEVVVGARFRDMFVEAADGRPRIDRRRFHELERVS